MRDWAMSAGFAVIVASGMILAQEPGAHHQKSAAETAAETGVPGNPVHGWEIFEGKGGCLSCHRVGDRGSRMGPNLSDIATRRTVDELQNALLNPKQTVDAENRLYEVVTADGKTFTGKLLNQDVSSLQMLDSKDELRAFPKSTLRKFDFVSTTPMPSYREKLNAEEQTDLIAFLATLKGVIKQ
jgi:putative heme-binding domain-containing protein